MFFHPTPAFKAYLAGQREVEAEYFNDEKCKTESGSPCSCPHCQSINLGENVLALEGYVTSEYEVVCRDCLRNLAYWAYGSFQPSFPPETQGDFF